MKGKCGWCGKEITDEQTLVETFAGGDFVTNKPKKGIFHEKCAIKVLESYVKELIKND